MTVNKRGRKPVLITAGGETRTIEAWAAYLGMSPQAVRVRLQRRTTNDALLLPKRGARKRALASRAKPVP